MNWTSESVPTNGPRILVVSEERGDYELATMVLQSALPGARLTEASSASAIFTALKGGPYDVVITSLAVDGAHWSFLLEMIRVLQTTAKIIVLLDPIDEELETEALGAGAAECVVKSSRGFLDLTEAVQRALRKTSKATTGSFRRANLQAEFDRIESAQERVVTPAAQAGSGTGSFSVGDLMLEGPPGSATGTFVMAPPAAAPESAGRSLVRDFAIAFSVVAGLLLGLALPTWWRSSVDSTTPAGGEAVAQQSPPTQQSTSAPQPMAGQNMPSGEVLGETVAAEPAAGGTASDTPPQAEGGEGDVPPLPASVQVAGGRTTTIDMSELPGGPRKVATVDIADTPEATPPTDSTASVSQQAPARSSEVPDAQVAAAAATPRAASTTGASNESASETAGVTLAISALDEVWLSLIVDDVMVMDAILQAGETHSFQGESSAVLRVGNAAGLAVVWNGQDIGALGEEGQVRRLHFTPTEFGPGALPSQG